MMSREQLVLFELIENPKIDINLLNEKSVKIDTLGEYLLNKQNLLNCNRSEIYKIFENLHTKEDSITKKILQIHYDSL
jgi:hypothetical protein